MATAGRRRNTMNRRHALFALTTAVVLAGCESSGGGYSGSSVYYGYGHSWYDEPAYWYNDPDYVVVDPPRPDQPIRPGARPENPIAPVPGEPGTVRPEQPIVRPDPVGPMQPVGPQPSVRDYSSQSRMPASQPRMSRPSSRPSIPNRSRGGGFRGGGGRRR
jgi:hypothetical protein